MGKNPRAFRVLEQMPGDIGDTAVIALRPAPHSPADKVTAGKFVPTADLSGREVAGKVHIEPRLSLREIACVTA